MQNKLVKYGLAFIILLVLGLLSGILYLIITCQAVQIANLRGGQRISLVSQKGNGFEPDNCGSLMVRAIE